ncbi:unnamed protein product [Bemisia tabaci]|uniref:Ribonuclease P protein subunit p29 n=1 Tax=Bemisia tabaci TaxID=7038 RepID=A0A9P0AI54_BEMTA|nr:PREDICTED: ribonuclease P protein subunit p29 [Bemisia tabaci]CAH0392266.1 unnamed protein product [Bemisia tabaci]
MSTNSKRSNWNEPLPPDVKQGSKCFNPDALKTHTENLEEREKALIKYACKTVTIETIDTIKAGLERRQGFKYTKRKRVDEPTKNKTSLSISKKRQLGLYSLPRNTISYADALPMHQLWLEYIQPFLPNMKVKPNVEQRLKFFKQEYIGAMIEVVRSKCPSLVGLRGIVIFETKFTFKIVCEDDISKIIPKASCVFSVIIDKVCLTIYGNYFVVRPAERINKKIKQKVLFDL